DAASSAEAMDAWLRFFKAIKRWGMRVQNPMTFIGQENFVRVVLAFSPDQDGLRRLAAVQDLVSWEYDPSPHVGFSVLQVVPALSLIGDRQEPLRRAQINRIIVAALAFVCITHLYDEPAENDEDSTEFLMKRAEEAASHVDEIALSFAGNRDFELERARAWAFIASAMRKDAARSETIAKRVDELARPFPSDRDFELERARAWAFIAGPMRKDAVRGETIAKRVDEIALSFAGDRDFELARARAWAFVAEARPNDTCYRAKIAERVHDIALPFAGDRDFALEHARAWTFVNSAVDPEQLDSRSCEVIAKRVDEIARPFSGERWFEYLRANAWSQTALAQMNDFAVCEVAARRVEEISRVFQGDQYFGGVQANAWRAVAHALRSDPD